MFKSIPEHTSLSVTQWLITSVVLRHWLGVSKDALHAASSVTVASLTEKELNRCA